MVSPQTIFTDPFAKLQILPSGNMQLIIWVKDLNLEYLPL